MTNVNANELFKEMQKYKAHTDSILCDDGKKRSVDDVLIPIMQKYLENYDDMELRSIVSGDNAELSNSALKMDTKELHIRLHRARMILAQPIPSSTNYACITLNISGFNFAYIYILLSNPVSLSYISLGDSIKSYDGEWRCMMMNNNTYEYLIAHKAKSINKLIEAVDLKKHKPKLNIYYNTALVENIIESINELINDQFSIGVMVLTWFIARYYEEVEKSHSPSAELMKFASSIGSSSIVSLLGIEEVKDIFLILGSFLDTRGSQSLTPIFNRATPVGQKLIQITPDEASHPLNNLYQVWNEIAVTRSTADLIFNMICPSFPMRSFWIMIFETSKFLYNSKNMRKKIEVSQSIRLTPADKRTSKILSDKAVCIVNEYCGPTFRFSLINNTERMLRFGNKYLFEAIYGIFCLHSLLGQFHGDFHSDNATIMRLVEPNASSVWKIAYIIGKDIFTFIHDGSYACVIDFSRTIQFDNPSWIERIVEKYELYFKEPKDNNRARFNDVVYNALDDAEILAELKKVASAFDIFEFANSILMQCEKQVKGSDFGKLVEDLKRESQKILIEYITDDYKSAGGSLWAAHILLKKYWPAADSDALSDPTQFRGIYSYGNPMKYSARAYKDLPRSISMAPMIRDPQDEPVNTYSSFASVIKARYSMTEENLKKLFETKKNNRDALT